MAVNSVSYPVKSLFKFMAKHGNLFCLFQHNSQQDGFKRQERIGLADGSDVFARRDKDTVEYMQKRKSHYLAF